jgi:methionyl-tRNA formyltransferase
MNKSDQQASKKALMTISPINQRAMETDIEMLQLKDYNPNSHEFVKFIYHLTFPISHRCRVVVTLRGMCSIEKLKYK